METIKWSGVNKELTIKELVSKGEYFVPSSVCNEEVDVSSILSNIDAAIKTKLTVKNLEPETGDGCHIGMYLEDGAIQCIVLAFFYHLCYDMGIVKIPRISFVNIAIGDDGLLNIVDENNRVTESWLMRLKKKVSEFCGVEDIECLEKDWTNNFSKKIGKDRGDFVGIFTNNMVKISWNTAVYTGSTIDIDINGEMTVGEFKKNFEGTFHAIPLLLDKDKKEYPDNLKLSKLGIVEPTTYKLPERSYVNKLYADFRQLYKLDLLMKYQDRPWAWVMGETKVNQLTELPSIWESIKSFMLMKFIV